MRTFMRRSPKIKPLLDIHCNWMTEESTYPETVDINFRDGRTKKYVIIAPPTRLFLTNDRQARNLNEVVGYQYWETKRPSSKVTSFLRRR